VRSKIATLHIMPIKYIKPEILAELHGNNAADTLLSKDAVKNSEALRFLPENHESEIRPPFFHDTDRIIHSQAYTRYIDKTQVFYLCENDHLTHRVLHVQLVAKIARTLGRVLKYNEDLIEAIALGHDVGHSPFGHTGERFLSSFLKRKKEGVFATMRRALGNCTKLKNRRKALCKLVYSNIGWHTLPQRRMD